jgi:hypothetical protein
MKVVEFWVHTSFGTWRIGGREESEMYLSPTSARIIANASRRPVRKCAFCDVRFRTRNTRKLFCSSMCKSRALVRHYMLATGKEA